MHGIHVHEAVKKANEKESGITIHFVNCLLYTSDAADERSSVDLGGRRIIKKKNSERKGSRAIT